MKLMKILLLVLCFSFINANGMEQPSMPFRIGLEFQMNGRLCEWALNDHGLQKKPIFIIVEDDKEICHVELDGPDIEFVTEHFAKEEKNQLLACVKAIKTIIDVTKIQLDSNLVINFKNWLDTLFESTKLQIKTTPFFETIKEGTIKKLNSSAPWEPTWQPQMTVQHPLQNTIALCNELFPNITSMQTLIKQSTPTNISPATALAGLMFLTAHEMVGMTNSYLMPLHPDHLLDLSMALAMYFHGQDLTKPDLLQLSINALSNPGLKELETHPLMRPCLVAIFEQDTHKQQELFSNIPMGDLFIKNMFAAIPNLETFLKIANNDKFMYKAILLRDTFESYNTVHQFDAKRWTNFMSRRPFSHMLREIIDGGTPIVSDTVSTYLLNKDGGFSPCFNERISFADQLPNGFHLANYAEQFVDENNHPLNLEALLDFFNPTIQGSMFLRDLLKNGVFCTTMFSVMDIDKSIPNVTITAVAKEVITEVLNSQYTTVVLKSLDQPKQRNFLFIIKESSSIIIDAMQLNETELPSDLLSPPFLLDKSNSMGQYRKGVFHSEYDPNTFGSAIVEFRNIQQAKHLKSMENAVAQSGFLTIPTFVEEEALNVFNVLCGLTVKL